MSLPIRLVIFDLDGTLINAYPAVYRSVNFAMRSAGLPPIPHKVIHRTVGWGDSHLMETFVGKERLPDVLKVYRRHHARSLEQGTRCLPGARRLLKELDKRGFRLAVASNRPTRFSRIILRHLDLLKHFDHVLCGDKVARAKPHPDILLAVMKRLKAAPAETLYVGDMVIDVEAGNRAGVRTVAVTTGSSTRGELAALKPLKIVPNVYQVAPLLGRLTA